MAAIQSKSKSIVKTPHDFNINFGIFKHLVVVSPLMFDIYNKARKVATTSANVLIEGETGVGKDILAKFIHCLSERGKEVFAHVAISGLTENLLASELFGHQKGSFTGAADDHIGWFEKAHGGSLYLDEIGELPIMTQVKVLRFIEERCIERVGSTDRINLDVRLLAATNADLKSKIQINEFRSDLYHRLSVIRLKIPPLRERMEEIKPLTEMILRSCKIAHSKVGLKFGDDIIEAFQSYQWPGNIREMKHVIEQMVIFGSGELGYDDLPEEVRMSLKENSIDPRNANPFFPNNTIIPLIKVV